MHDQITREEIEKWTEKIEPILESIEICDNRGEEMLSNMKAYIADSKHFLEKGDFVKSFEAMVWSWAIFEICLELEIFRVESFK